jgi:hypothetical protein
LPEWLIETGIGEDRAILVEDDTILAARVCWREPWRAGAVAPARLDHRYSGSKRGAVHLPDGTIATIDALPAEVTHGATLMVRITRAALAEQGRFKLAQCRPAGDAAPCPAPSLAETLAETGIPVRTLGMLDRSFDTAGWDELVEQAQTGVIDFGAPHASAPHSSGRLTISPTPAMTLIDIDGPPPLLALAHGAIPVIATALARLDIAGSVGIDFPGLESRPERQAVDQALDTALTATGWRGERTGMNGFGFVQLISRLARPSLIARLAFHPARAAAYALLRQAERVAEPGALVLIANPSVLAAIDPTLEAELARRSGRLVQREPRNALALHAGFAQALAL